MTEDGKPPAVWPYDRFETMLGEPHLPHGHGQDAESSFGDTGGKGTPQLRQVTQPGWITCSSITCIKKP